MAAKGYFGLFVLSLVSAVVAQNDTSPPSTTTTTTTTTTDRPTTTTREPAVCEYGNNTLGICECGAQLFINNDCTQGFYCMETELPEGGNAQGCMKTCKSDEILQVNVKTYTWECVLKRQPGALPLLCPGSFNTECPGNGDIKDCQCDGQLWISDHCRKGFYCDGKGGEDINCEEDQRIDINLNNMNWTCIQDDGNCLGDFHVGCEDTTNSTTTTMSTTTTVTTTTKPSTILCSYANNTLGTCECGKQLFINQNCTQGFYCMDSGFPEGVNADGCIKTCRPDEILIVDVGKYDWECVPKSFRPDVLNRICPGEFKVECPGNGDIGECECDGQLWIDDTCRNGFYCDSRMAGNGIDIKCNDTERIDVDMIEQSWKCIPDDNKCPGGLHTKCQATTTTTTTTTTTESSSSAIVESFLTLQLVGLAIYFGFW